MVEFIDKYLGEFIVGLLGAISVYITNLVNKRKLNAEIKTTEIENFDKQVAVYQKMIDDLETRFQKMHDQNAQDIEELKKKLFDVERHWKEKYDRLKKEFDNYKKEHP